jgi:hypothetical protein
MACSGDTDAPIAFSFGLTISQSGYRPLAHHRHDAFAAPIELGARGHAPSRRGARAKGDDLERQGKPTAHSVVVHGLALESLVLRLAAIDGDACLAAHVGNKEKGGREGAERREEGRESLKG